MVRYILIAALSACVTLGAKVASDRLSVEHDTAVSSVEIANLKSQLKETSDRLEKHMDGLDAKFDQLQREVLRTPREREQVGRPRPIN